MLNWLEEKLQLLNPVFTQDDSGGYTRLGFSQEEQLAIQAFISIAKDLDLTIQKDEIGNVIAKLSGENEQLPSIAFGSHLDTVTCGGAYDGVAGVLAGLGVIKRLKIMKYKPLHSIEIICFVSEESSRFGVSTIGSKAMVGLLDVDSLMGLEDNNKVTFRNALEMNSLSVQAIKQMDWKQKRLHSFVELHIEQGRTLRDSNKQIGVVTGIASPLRYKVLIHGEASHTGTTAMGKRKDALAIAARIIIFVEELGFRQAEKDQFVATVSTANLMPNVMNVIPETVELGIDIRSTNIQLKKESEQMIQDHCTYLSNNTGLQIELTQLSNEQPVFMDQFVIDQLKIASTDAGKTYQEIDSGAGHDAMNMAKRWSTGMVFIPCRGISHNPNEFTETINIMNGIEVLTNYIKQVDKGV